MLWQFAFPSGCLYECGLFLFSLAAPSEEKLLRILKNPSLQTSAVLQKQPQRFVCLLIPGGLRVSAEAGAQRKKDLSSLCDLLFIFFLNA